MLREIITVIKNDSKLRYILLAGIFVQLVFCITATGFYHPDQHFQVIELSSLQLGDPSGFPYVWEYEHPVRATLQVYLFSGYHLLITALGIDDPYIELTILRIILGLLMFAVFNIISIHYFKNEKRMILYSVLLLLNFSWFLPYTRTLFSGEMLSSVLFFGTVFWYDIKKDKKPRIGFLLLVGVLLSLIFYIRFQSGFFIAGFGIWLLLQKQNLNHYILISLGFIVGVFFNTWLDYGYYNQLIITPYEYFYTNLIDKRAASFGTSSFLLYIGVFIVTVGGLPFSIILFLFAIKSFLKKYTHLVFLTSMLFIIGHSVVGHKEERFVFPVLCIMPVIIGWGLPSLMRFHSSSKKIFRYLLNTIIVFSVGLNVLMLVLLMFNPYCQTIRFTALLKKEFAQRPVNLHCLNRTPFETESKIPITFYKRHFPNLEIIRVDGEEIKQINYEDQYLAATFDQVVKVKSIIDSLGYKPVFYSSSLLWKLNKFLYSQKAHPINEIWVLYKK